MIRFSKSIAALVASGILTACATAGKDVASSYVSPMQYANYDCDQLRAESMRISGRVNQLTGRLDEAASNDKSDRWRRHDSFGLRSSRWAAPSSKRRNCHG